MKKRRIIVGCLCLAALLALLACRGQPAPNTPLPRIERKDTDSNPSINDGG